MAYTFFDNYHETIKEFSNGSLETYGRLMMIINSYAIEGVILDDLTPTEKLFFNIVKPNLDKSIAMRERGKKGGRPEKNLNETRLKPNSNMVKTKNDLGFYEEEEEREIEKENEIEIEVEKEEEKITQSELLQMCTEKGLYLDSSFLTSSFIKKINNNFISPRSAALDRLAYVFEKYKNKDNDGKAAMFVKSFSWDISQPEKKPAKTKNIKSIDYSLAPKKCECGASVTPWGVPNSVKCVACSKTWELNNGLWVSTN